MQSKLTSFFSGAIFALWVISPKPTLGQESPAQTPASVPNQIQQQTDVPKLQLRSWIKPVSAAQRAAIAQGMSSGSSFQTLPLFLYSVQSSRDGNLYPGGMVGHDPFNGGGGVGVPTIIVPLIVKTHTLGISVDSKGIVSTKPGVTVSDSTAADRSCLGSGNNVPLTLLQQSPLIKSATFDFGGTVVGTTQYIDAFRRAEFWEVNDHDRYHLLLNPVTALSPIYLDVPADKGLALAPSVLGTCGPLTILDIQWFDLLLDTSIIPSLSSRGVNPATFPIFFGYNTVYAVSPINDLGDCCFGGYHSYGYPIPLQTYAVSDWDSTRLFGSSGLDASILSHEIGEWADDPYVMNPTPPWGHTGQVAFCQNNLEVGDPLSGTKAPPIAMLNGFTYHLQELAFFSWFFGQPSVGIHRWYSNNGTFLTDAGPPCQ